MNPRGIHIAVLQPFCVPGDIDGNLERMEELLVPLAARGAQLALFSEGGVTGYRADAPRVRAEDATWRRLSQMATRTRCAVVAGFVEAGETGNHITQGCFHPGGRVDIQRKHRAAAVEEALEDFVCGPTEPTVFTVEGVRCAIAICADFGREALWENLKQAGVELLLLPTAACGSRALGYSLKALDDPATFEAYLCRESGVYFSADALRDTRRTGIALATCNQLALHDDYFHPGHSMVVSAVGQVLTLLPGSLVFEFLRPRADCVFLPFPNLSHTRH